MDQSKPASGCFAILFSPAEGTGGEVNRATGVQDAFLQSLVENGKVIHAGSFSDDSGGLAIVAADNLAEAWNLASNDPAVVNGSLILDVKPWSPLSTSVSERNAETARRLFNAVEKRDGPVLLSCYDEEILIHEAPSLPYGGDFTGMEGAVKHSRGFLECWGRMQDEEERKLEPRFLANEECAVVVWRHRARDPATNRSIDLPVVSVYDMASSKIVESRMFFFDTVAVREFLDSVRAAPGRSSASETESPVAS